MTSIIGSAEMLADELVGPLHDDQRAIVEEELKSGRLRCVVATSSLELGIDMGAVDAVIQVESPPSVASGLQRVGRAGHQVGAASRGVFFPNHRGDLVESTVIVDRMRQGRIEDVPLLRNPLDVLAQQIVATTVAGPIGVDELFALADEPSDVDLVWGLERELSGGEARDDAARLAALLHHDFVGHGASGRVWQRRDVDDAGALGPAVILEPLAAEPLADDLLLLRYRTSSDSGEGLGSSLWQRVNGTWRLRFRQATPSAD